MRYRSFTSAGLSCSAITLSVPDGLDPAHASRIVCAALELGINSFCFELEDAGAARAIHAALATVERRMLLVLLRGSARAATLERELDTALGASGIGYADAFLLDRPQPGALDPADRLALERVRASRRATRIGLLAEGEAADHHLKQFDFDVLATPYSVRSGWPERNRIKSATQHGLSIMGYGYHVDAARELKAENAPPGLRRLFHKPSNQVTHAYDFLERTPNWTGRQLTLAYALTEPALASVLVETADPAELEQLAAAVERELPSGAAAQIEIARFAA